MYNIRVSVWNHFELPGEFFDDNKVESLPDPISHVAKFKSVMTEL